MQNKQWHVLLTGLLSIVFVLWLSPQAVFADIDNLSVTPVVANSDVTDRFEIVGKPGETRKLTISFTNTGTGAQALRVVPTNASTSLTGEFTYGTPVKSNHYGLPFNFNAATQTKDVTVPASGSKDVTFKVKLPESKFTGLVIGGFHIMSAADVTQYVDIPVWLTMTNDLPSPKLMFMNLEGASHSSQTYLDLNIANMTAVALNNVSYSFTITSADLLSRVGINKRQYQAVKSDLKVAPNSLLTIPFNTHDAAIAAGKYEIKGTIKSNGQSWNINTNAVVDKQSADRANAKDPNLIRDYTLWFVLGILALVILIGVVLSVIFVKPRHDKAKH